MSRGFYFSLLIFRKMIIFLVPINFLYTDNIFFGFFKSFPLIRSKFCKIISDTKLVCNECYIPLASNKAFSGTTGAR